MAATADGHGSHATQKLRDPEDGHDNPLFVKATETAAERQRTAKRFLPLSALFSASLSLCVA